MRPEAEKPRSREAEKPLDKPRGREAESREAESREAEKPRSREAEKPPDKPRSRGFFREQRGSLGIRDF